MSRISRIVIAATIVIWANRGWAQDRSVHLDQYRAAETTSDGFAISRPADLGHLRASVQLHLDYAYDPLVVDMFEDHPPHSHGAIVEHELAADLSAALGLIDRLVVTLGLPVDLVLREQDMIDPGGAARPGGASVGDLRVGARLRLLGAGRDLFGLGIQATMTLPTARWARADQAYAGEASVTGHFEVLAEVRPGPVQITVNIGTRVRRAVDMVLFETGNELTWGLGVTWRVIDPLELMIELYGASVLATFGARETTPIEALGGLRLLLPRGVVVGLAAGSGILRGAGAPRARVVATCGWAMEPERMPGDRDNDGIEDSADECPDVAEDDDGYEDDDGCPDTDDDLDGVEDSVDRCPREAEDRDDFEDDDGCPDPDNDDDSVADGDDLCPLEAEDHDDFEDDDGCPDPDNDGDSVADNDDLCPLEAEDRDDFEDDDGCPDPDNDGDSVADNDDLCPLTRGRPEDSGCPEAIRLGPQAIRILQRIRFESDSATLHATATPILEQVAELLRSTPNIRRVAVVGHTDDRHTAAYNLELSQRRAQAVVDWLTGHGVEGERLVAVGRGETQPIESNATAEGRRANRRVEFEILDGPREDE